MRVNSDISLTCRFFFFLSNVKYHIYISYAVKKVLLKKLNVCANKLISSLNNSMSWILESESESVGFLFFFSNDEQTETIWTLPGSSIGSDSQP